MKHELKIEPAFFEAVKSGQKNFELRFNDRGYQKGDVLHLKPFHNSFYVEPYEGCLKEVTYVMSGYGLKDGWVCLGLKDI